MVVFQTTLHPVFMPQYGLCSSESCVLSTARGASSQLGPGDCPLKHADRTFTPILSRPAASPAKALVVMGSVLPKAFNLLLFDCQAGGNVAGRRH